MSFSLDLIELTELSRNENSENIIKIPFINVFQWKNDGRGLHIEIKIQCLRKGKNNHY